MKKRLKQLGIALSLAFNLAVIAGTIYAVYFAKPASTNNPIGSTVYRKTNLTPEQKQALKQMLAEPARRMIELRRQRQAKWAEAVELLSQPQPDWEALRAKQAELGAVQRELESVIFRGWVDSTSIMTPEQRLRFFQIIQQEIQSGELFSKQTPDANRRSEPPGK